MINSAVISSTASFKDTECSNQNPINIKANSRMGNITARGSIPGARGIPMKGTIKMERSMVMEFIRVMMDLCIRDLGKKGSGMARGFRSILWESVRRFGFRWGLGKSMRLSLDLYCV